MRAGSPERLALLSALLLAACERQRAVVPLTTRSSDARADYEEARGLEDEHRTVEARAAFLRAVREDPDFGLAFLGLAETSATHSGTFEAIRRAVELSDRVSEGERRMILGSGAGVERNLIEQAAHYRSLVDSYPEDARARILAGGAESALGDEATALAQFERATQLEPGFGPAWLELAGSLTRSEAYDEAARALERGLALMPGSSAPHVAQAELWRASVRFALAEESYERALADENCVPARVGLGNLQVLMGRHDQALATFRGLEERARNVGEKRAACSGMALAHLQAHDHRRAAAEFERAAELARTANDLAAVSEDLESLATVLLETGDPDSALAIYAESLGVMERSNAPTRLKQLAATNLLYHEARVALASGDLDGARSRANDHRASGIELGIPEGQLRHFEIFAEIALRSGSYGAALRVLKEANPKTPRALYLEALSSQEAGNWIRARDLASKIMVTRMLDLESTLARIEARRILDGLASNGPSRATDPRGRDSGLPRQNLSGTSRVPRPGS